MQWPMSTNRGLLVLSTVMTDATKAQKPVRPALVRVPSRYTFQLSNSALVRRRYDLLLFPTFHRCGTPLSFLSEPRMILTSFVQSGPRESEAAKAA